MNLRQPYEQLIADKLRRLPAPEADVSWKQMKQLLDNEDNRPGGGKRPPGNNGNWWRISIVVMLLAAGGWLYIDTATTPSTLAQNNKTTAPLNMHTGSGDALKDSKKIIPNNQAATIDKNITLPDSINTASSATNGKNKVVAILPVITNNKKAGAITEEENSSTDISSVTRAGTGIDKNKNLTGTASSDERVEDNVKNTVKNSRSGGYKSLNTFVAVPTAAKNKKRKGIATTGNSSIDVDNTPSAGINEATTAAANNSHQKHNSIAKPGVTSAGNFADAGLLNSAGIKEKSNAGKQPASPNLSKFNHPPAEKTLWAQLNSTMPETFPLANTSLLVVDSNAGNRNTANLFNTETKKLVAKVQRDKSLEDMARKEKKLFHLNLSNAFKPFSLRMDADPRWAAGVSLNSGIPVNAQRRYNYSMNGKSGTLSDYIPSVYLQFHLNDYVYAQTEINFISPQYTPQLLIYQQSSDVAGQAGISQQKSVYLQKLYYFNLPFSLHYSPVNNFYFSAGLQFSSFQSGLVSIQQKQYDTQAGPDHANSISNEVVKFKDDSIAAKLSPNEWRWQAGADYYWNRFSIGLRYNRAFKNIANVSLSATLPATSIRNESMLFFIRYNLFESRKKGNGDQKN